MKQSDDSDRVMIDRVPTMARRCRPDGFVEFFNRRWLEYTGLFLDNALGWGWTIAVHRDDLESVERQVA
jgi:PAS domain-containing protein